MKLTTSLHAAIKRVYVTIILDNRRDPITIMRCQHAMDYLLMRNARTMH